MGQYGQSGNRIREEQAEQAERAEMFMNFQKRFNEIMADYRPQEQTVDYDSMIDESYKNEVEENTSEVFTPQIVTTYVPIFIDREREPKTLEVEDKGKYDPNSTDRNY